MKIYVAGPMSGVKDWNFPAFFEAEDTLVSLGHEVINPAHNDGPDLESALLSAGSPDKPNHTWAWYMRRDLPHVMEVEALCVLPGWQNSKGASLEVHVAKALGLPIMVLKDGKLVPRITAVGVSGWARSGKDTIADHLEQNHGFTKFSFANPMRDALYALNPRVNFSEYDELQRLRDVIDIHGWDHYKETEYGDEIRGLMQRLGTEVGREMFGQNFWVDRALASIPDGGRAVFADVRFPNEAEAIRALGGAVWRVEREGVGPANDHISEHALNNYDFTSRIVNAGTLEELYELTDKLMEGQNA